MPTGKLFAKEIIDKDAKEKLSGASSAASKAESLMDLLFADF